MTPPSPATRPLGPTDPTRSHAQPRPGQLPAGVLSGPATIPNRPPAPAPLHSPTTEHTPRTTACLLCTLLRQNGLTGLYAFTFGNVAVVSLPHLTVWINPRILYWTHDGKITTWPACDTTGATRQLTRLVQPHSGPPPPP